MTVKDEFQKNYPFVACIKIGLIECVGIVINHDNLVVSMYNYAGIAAPHEQQLLLTLGETWWWESNRKIPINIFLYNEMQQFRPYIRTFNAKDAQVLFGPTISLSDIAEKRVKRKSIQLVKVPKRVK